MSRVIKVILKELVVFQEKNGRNPDFILVGCKAWLELKSEMLTFGNEEENKELSGIDIRQDKKIEKMGVIMGVQQPFDLKPFIPNRVWWWQ